MATLFTYYYLKGKDKRELMFAIGFALSTLSFLLLVLGMESTSLVHKNIYQLSALPILIAIFVSVNESIFKVKDFDKVFKAFTALSAVLFIIVFIPIDTGNILPLVRQGIAFEIIFASVYLFFKNKEVSNLLFLLSLLCFTISGITLARNIVELSIFADFMAYTFLALVFVNVSLSPKKDKHGIGSYFSLKSKLASAEQELLESEEKYKTLFDLSPDAIMLISEDGKILSVNKTMAEGFGTSVEELTGKNVHSLLPKDVDGKRTTAAKKALATGEIQTNEDERAGRYFHNTFIPIFTSDGEKSIQVIARDTTKQKKIEKEIEKRIDDLEETEIATLNIMEDLHETIADKDKAKEEIKEKNEELLTSNENLEMINKELKVAREQLAVLNQNLESKVQERTVEIEMLLKQKDEFIGQLGHDLKTPITPLNTLLPIVKKRVKDPNLKALLEVSIKNVDFMKKLITKTLQLAHLNSPNLHLEIEDTNLLEELNNIISSNQNIFEENNIKIENMVDEEIIVRADKLRFDELLNNLIGNAVKYSQDAGKIIVNAKKEKDTVKISIKDNGQGMSKEQIRHIFEEFYKADEARHDFDSSGLGLSICKRIVERHGGRIWAESPGVGKGSTFYFTIKTASNKKNN